MTPLQSVARPIGYLTALFVILAISAHAALPVPPVSAHSGDVLAASGTATVDGALSPGEYGSCIGPITQGAYTFTICETNDNVNDYWAFQVNDLSHNVGDGTIDILDLSFDNTHDGIIAACPGGNPPGSDDTLRLSASAAGFQDANYGSDCWADDTAVGGTRHGTGQVSWNAVSGYVFEMSHPMKSGETIDYGLVAGSTVGWCVEYADALSTVVNYPLGCGVGIARGDASDYGNAVKRFLPRTAVGGEILTVDRERIALQWLALTVLLGLTVMQFYRHSRRSKMERDT